MDPNEDSDWKSSGSRSRNQKVFSEAELDALMKKPELMTSKLAFEVLNYLDPDAQQDKLLEKGKDVFWVKKESVVYVDLKIMRTKFRPEFKKFQSDPKNWIYTFLFQWWNCNKEFVQLSFRDKDPKISKIFKIKQTSLGKYVSIKGTIRRISEVNAAIVSSEYQCKHCSIKKRSDRLWYQKVKINYCACGAKDSMIELEAKRHYEVWQCITVQEDLTSGLFDQKQSSVETLEIRLLSPKWFNSFLPGQTVTVKGILRAEVQEKAKSRVYLDALYLDSSVMKIKRSAAKKTQDSFEEIFKQPNKWEFFKKVIFQKIYGLERLKDASLLQLFGGSNSTRRSEIHILCVGNPGTGKSETMRTLHSIFGGIYVTGIGSTAAGLTATVYKEADNQWQLDGGALVCANMNTLYLDQIDKMPNSACNALLEAMEQQCISISKAGLNMSLPAKTKVFAVCNPKYKCFFDQQRPPLDQISLSTPLLSRFDLIVIVKEELDQISVELMTQTMFSKNQKKLLRLIEEYIVYSKTLEVEVSSEVRDLINQFYKKLCKIKVENFLVGPRRLESLYRLCEAKSRSELRTTVSKEDFNFVKDLLTETISGMLGFDVFLESRTQMMQDLLEVKLTKREAEISIKVLEISQQMIKKRDLYVLVSEQCVNTTLKEFESCLRKLQRDGLIYEPKPTYVMTTKTKR